MSSDTNGKDESPELSKIVEFEEKDDLTENDSETEAADDETSSSPKQFVAPSKDERNLENVFRSPPYVEPRHPILSSSFCRHIAVMAYGPTKPPWYQQLVPSQLYLFNDLINYIKLGRSGHFHFERFLSALQDFDPSVTRAEVVEILESLKTETSPFEELDFGKFLFLLAYKEQVKESESTEKSLKRLSSITVTRRQCLLLSAISYFVLITTPDDIQRYYYDTTRRKATVLHHHMVQERLSGLTEFQLEKTQRNASRKLGPLHQLTASPYAKPVPFVHRFKKGQIYTDWKKKYGGKYYKKEKKRELPVHIKTKRELGDTLTHQTEHDKLISAMIYGKLPLPKMRFTQEVFEQVIKGGFTVKLKDYLMEKAEIAKKEYRQMLKEVGAVCAEHYLRPILKQGFPTRRDTDMFLEVYKRYFPLEASEWPNVSLWVKPRNFKVGNKGPLYPDKIVFGKIFK